MTMVRDRPTNERSAWNRKCSGSKGRRLRHWTMTTWIFSVRGPFDFFLSCRKYWIQLLHVLKFGLMNARREWMLCSFTENRLLFFPYCFSIKGWRAFIKPKLICSRRKKIFKPTPLYIINYITQNIILIKKINSTLDKIFFFWLQYSSIFFILLNFSISFVHKTSNQYLIIYLFIYYENKIILILRGF